MKIKVIAASIFTLMLSITIQAQAPQKMSYQAVIRNASGNLVASTPVGVKISILQGSVAGTPVYVETHNLSTNGNGLLTMEIGGGNAQTGIFSTIDWSNGPYFVKNETDPNGGSNYTISGTSQLLSVPYALYAENTKSQGKTTIYLVGDITNAEAAAKIAAEAGPNTENVYIVSTSQLTTVTIDNIQGLINLKINNNQALQSVTINDVTSVNENFIINNNPSLQTVSLPDNLRVAGDKFNISANVSLSSFSMPNLTHILGRSITFASNSNLTISFPNLQMVAFTGIGGTNDDGFLVQNSSIDFPSLTNVNWMEIYYSGSTYTINLPSLQQAGYLKLMGTGVTQLELNSLTNGYLDISSQILSSLSVPNLSSGTIKIMGSGQLTSLSFPSFIYGGIYIKGNAQLASVAFPSLATCGLSGSNMVSTIANNPNLINISIPVLSSLDNSIYPFPSFQLNQNAFPSSMVNYVLNKMLTVTPLKGVNLTQSPPTGQGIIDKQTLISAGNNILTN